MLDDFFASSKEGKMNCLDMHRLIEKLEVCSKTITGQYTPLSYPFYQQDLWVMVKGGEAAQKTGKQALDQTGN